MPRVLDGRVGYVVGWAVGAGVGAVSIQMTTMPDVAVGWLLSLLHTFGGIFSQENSYLGRERLITPLWDVLAPQEEQEQALNCLTTHPRSLTIQIKQAVLVGLLRSVLLLGLLGSIFHGKKYVLQYIQCSRCLQRLQRHQRHQRPGLLKAKCPRFELLRAFPKHCHSIPKYSQSILRALLEHSQISSRAL